jgi:hypothetical protein
MGVGGQRHVPAAFTPGEEPVPIAQEAGWAPPPVWIGAEYLASTGIRSPDLPARSESLYRLSHSGHTIIRKRRKLNIGKFLALDSGRTAECAGSQRFLDLAFIYISVWALFSSGIRRHVTARSVPDVSGIFTLFRNTGHRSSKSRGALTHRDNRAAANT